MHGTRNFNNLRNSLAGCKYHLWHSLPEMAVMVDPRERDIFIWQMLQLPEGLPDRETAVFYGGKEIFDFAIIHWNLIIRIQTSGCGS